MTSISSDAMTISYQQTFADQKTLFVEVPFVPALTSVNDARTRLEDMARDVGTAPKKAVPESERKLVIPQGSTFRPVPFGPRAVVTFLVSSLAVLDFIPDKVPKTTAYPWLFEALKPYFQLKDIIIAKFGPNAIHLGFLTLVAIHAIETSFVMYVLFKWARIGIIHAKNRLDFVMWGAETFINGVEGIKSLRNVGKDLGLGDRFGLGYKNVKSE